jgi:hypothetical protein
MKPDQDPVLRWHLPKTRKLNKTIRKEKPDMANK